VTPSTKVARHPVAIAERLEKIVRAVLYNGYRIGTGAIGDPFVVLLEVVSVIDVDRIRVCARRRLRCDMRCGTSEQRRYET
jgi:hypothetical protein